MFDDELKPKEITPRQAGKLMFGSAKVCVFPNKQCVEVFKLGLEAKAKKMKWKI